MSVVYGIDVVKVLLLVNILMGVIKLVEFNCGLIVVL